MEKIAKKINSNHFEIERKTQEYRLMFGSHPNLKDLLVIMLQNSGLNKTEQEEFRKYISRITSKDKGLAKSLQFYIIGIKRYRGKSIQFAKFYLEEIGLDNTNQIKILNKFEETIAQNHRTALQMPQFASKEECLKWVDFMYSIVMQEINAIYWIKKSACIYVPECRKIAGLADIEREIVTAMIEAEFAALRAACNLLPSDDDDVYDEGGFMDIRS